MTENEELGARLGYLLDALEGLACFSTIVGEGDDYALVLDLGEKRRRSLRLANPRLSFLQRTFEGESGLLVECPWRIEAEDGIIASCFDERTPGGRGAAAVADLVELRIESARAAGPGWDLEVRFSNGWTLRGFALEREARPRRDNWAVWTPGGSLVVGPRSQLEQDPPDGDGGSGGARWRVRLAARHGENDS